MSGINDPGSYAEITHGIIPDPCGIAIEGDIYNHTPITAPIKWGGWWEDKPKELKVRKLKPDATVPTKANLSDAGFDLYASEDATIFSGKTALIGTSIALEIPEGHVGLIWPRSGLSVKYGLDVLAGVIDSGYRGEIKVCLLNTKNIYSDIKITKGDKIAQILIQEVPRFIMVEAENLSESSRGEKGFGSSD